MKHEMMFPIWARATEYLCDVREGRVTVGLFERLAVERHFRDWDAQSFDDWPYRFDNVSAERACRFIETLHHVQGEWAAKNERIRLEGWQAFLIGSLFGWVRKDNGLRRFTYLYAEVGRKNAKSTLLGGTALYCTGFDGEAGAIVVSAATSSDQARKVFNPARAMVEKSVEMRTKGGMQAQARKITQPRSNSEFFPLPAQTKGLDGENPHCAVVDELHAHPNRDVLDVVRSGMGARSQPILAIITTAGSDLSGVCFEERCYIEKILKRVVEDDATFGMIFAIDEDDDPLDPKVWRKSNPNLGVSVNPDFLKREAARARQMPAQMGEFLRKYCCRWSAAGVSAVDIDGWRAGSTPDLTLKRIAALGTKIIAIDGSKNDDMTSLQIMGFEGDLLLAWDEHWWTTDMLATPGNEQVAAWKEAGWVNECEGASIKLNEVEIRVCELIELIGPDAIVYDPQYLKQLAENLEEKYPLLSVVEQRQSTMVLDPGLREMQSRARDHQILHRGSPVMTWMVSNARAKPSNAGGSEFLKLFKERPAAKIDGVQAMVTGLAYLEAPIKEQGSYLADSELVVL